MRERESERKKERERERERQRESREKERKVKERARNREILRRKVKESLFSHFPTFFISYSPLPLSSYFPNHIFTVFIFSFSHLISSNSNRHSPLKPSLLRAVKVLEQNAKSGTAITTGEGGRAVPRINGIGGVGSVVKD